jgi:hypothetical protein
MSDWNTPTLTTTYTDVLSNLMSRDSDVLKMLDGITSTNLPTSAKRWNGTNNTFENWNGSAWARLLHRPILPNNKLLQSVRIDGTTDYSIVGMNASDVVSISSPKELVLSAGSDTGAKTWQIETGGALCPNGAFTASYLGSSSKPVSKAFITNIEGTALTFTASVASFLFVTGGTTWELGGSTFYPLFTASPPNIGTSFSPIGDIYLNATVRGVGTELNVYANNALNLCSNNSVAAKIWTLNTSGAFYPASTTDAFDLGTTSRRILNGYIRYIKNCDSVSSPSDLHLVPASGAYISMDNLVAGTPTGAVQYIRIMLNGGHCVMPYYSGTW